ncbi:glycosyltransferase [Nostoc sp. FACHB-280]|uniref:glycosyltransferase n=1 Tax=Nostoc sp. FACHB-280 TaxID=2692839 RepID=UPI00168AA788|nr:glycosyltransferase [Nostoc sp. FACHB-280]MBD2498253.1 glycosyltransferase [Nostoc sp. FACHB-280]
MVRQQKSKEAIVGQHSLSVGILVDLEWGLYAGGHVKCWERFAEAAIDFPQIDITIYYLGHKPQEIAIAPNVRYRILTPMLGTKHIPFLHERSRNTDLAPYHLGLARQLRQHDVLHITSAFSFSRTAHWIAQRYNIPLVSSTHTDLGSFTRVYSQEIIRRILGWEWLVNLIWERWKLGERLEKQMMRRWHKLISDSDWVLFSKPEDFPVMQKFVSQSRLSRLRRGIDKQRFHPQHRDRTLLQTTFGIPPEVPVLLFVGRVDESKRIMTLAQAACQLLDQGYALHVLIVGEGTAKAKVKQLLEPHITLVGVLPQESLAWIYASADMFVFPSDSEISPNVVLEAKSSGLPVFVAAHSGSVQFIQQPNIDGIVVADSSPRTWADALKPYLQDLRMRRGVSRAARQYIEQCHPAWKEVFQEDLLPIWQKMKFLSHTKLGITSTGRRK